MKKVIAYTAALIIGIFVGFFVVFNSVFSDSSGSMWERIITFILVILGYGLPGIVLGYIMPDKSWRWGVWLSMPAVIIMGLYSIKEPGIIFLNLFYIVLTIASACYFSYIGAGFRKRRDRL